MEDERAGGIGGQELSLLPGGKKGRLQQTISETMGGLRVAGGNDSLIARLVPGEIAAKDPVARGPLSMKGQREKKRGDKKGKELMPEKGAHFSKNKGSGTVSFLPLSCHHQSSDPWKKTALRREPMRKGTSAPH
jgi:hypothetical protein